MFEAFTDLDPTWLLYGALTILPLVLGLLGFVLSVISRHKMRAIASIAVLMVVTGGAVMAYESEYDGDIPSNIEEVKRVPESVGNVIRNVMGNRTDDDMAQGQQTQASASTSTPTPTLTSTPRPRPTPMPTSSFDADATYTSSGDRIRTYEDSPDAHRDRSRNYIEWTTRPMVTDGILELAGSIHERRQSDWTFCTDGAFGLVAIYRWPPPPSSPVGFALSEEVVGSVIEPAGAGYFYTNLRADEVVADVWEVDCSSLRIRARVASVWPSMFRVGIWAQHRRDSNEWGLMDDERAK